MSARSASVFRSHGSRAMRLSSTAVIVIGLLVTVPAAGKERLAIHTIDVYGNGSETIRRDLRSAFLGGLAVAGFDIVPDDDLQRAVKGAPHLLSCSSETCLAGIGPLVGARWVLAAKIEVVSSALIAIDTRIVDSQTGKIAARLVQKSDGPNTWDENRNLASSVGATLYQRLEPLIAVAAQLPIPNV